MKIIGVLFMLATFATPVLMLVGCIKPDWVKQETRKHVLKRGSVLFLVLLVGTFMMAGIDYNLKKNMPRARDYTVVQADDYSFALRKRLRWAIVAPDAKTSEEKIYTAIQAARDLMNETPETDQVEIWLELDKVTVGSGRQLVRVTYTPDGKGNSGKEKDGVVWSVGAGKREYTDEEKKILLTWYTHREKFIKDYDLDEDGLRSFVAKKLNIPEEDFQFPYAGWKSYPYDGDEDYKVAGHKSPDSIENPESFAVSLCRRNPQCWGERYQGLAGVLCKDRIERLAPYAVKWTDSSWSQHVFSHSQWLDKKHGAVTYTGDRLQLQNAYGAWQNYMYECDFLPSTDDKGNKDGTVLDVRAVAGRL